MSAKDHEPATKADVEDVRTGLKTEIQAVRGELKTEIQAVRGELKIEIQAVRGELKIEIQAVRTELKADIGAVRDDLAAVEKRLGKAIVDIQGDLREMKESVPTKDAWGRLFKMLEDTMGEARDNRRTLLVYDDILGKHRKTLEEHDGRITTLEAKP